MASVAVSPIPSSLSSPNRLSASSPAMSVDELEGEPAEETIYTINHLIQARAKGLHGNEPIVAYPSSGTEYTYYTPNQLNTFVEAASVHYAKVIPQRRSSDDPVQVVGLLGPSDFEYMITLLAISRLGHTVLLLSTRIAEDAYVSLIENTKAAFLITHPSFQAVGEKVASRTAIVQQPVLTSENYNSPGADTLCLPPAQLDGSIEAKHICWIIHSSGSTGHPKPIYQTHSGALKNYANNFGLRGFITLPLPASAGNFKDHQEIEILYAVPYALKLLSESDEGLHMMARLELVMFGGSSCPKPIGDKLVQNGVRLVSHYGTTETGQLMTSFRERDDLDWDYVRPGPSLLPYLRWEEQMSGIYELCVLEGWPSKVASNRPDNSYATKDLFEKHPTKPNAWRYYARLDDTLVLENGEKANPLIIEGVARNDPNVAEAIVFGANKPRLGLFLIPATSSQCQTDDQLIEAVFPAIERCNAELPAYAYLSRDMIHVLPADAPYRKTDKGTVIRAAFYRDYQEQIDQIYDAEDASGDQVLEGAELEAFLREQLLEVAPNIDPSTLGVTTDIFSLGVDSLQSIRLRTTLLRTLDIGGHKLSENFVFEHPSVQAMADELTRLRLGQAPKEQRPVEERMADLIEKYGNQFKSHVAVPREEPGEHVVVTGATGSLGAHIVAQLAQMDHVKTIYCLVRAGSREAAFRRVRQSLRARGLSSILSPATEHKIISLPADLANPVRLGLDEGVYNRLVQSVTAVMHCAWSVNFNWALESFESSCIAGTRHLLDLCLDVHGPQPARFAFCSSVSTVARTPGNWVPEALPDSLACAQRMGYAQSKLVTEHIVNRAAHQAGITARVLRVGQIIADSVHGIWNATEAIPMMFQTAETIHALPQLDDLLSWTPVDVVATSVIDLTMASRAGEVVNLTNPLLSHWTRDLLPLLRQAGLEFEELSRHEWLQRLRESNQDPNVNPPIKLLEFFNSNRVLLYDTKQAAGGLTPELVSRFVQYFRTHCWSTSTGATTTAAPAREVIFLTGPCGCGKSTAAQALAQRFEIPVIEGDNLHSPAAREKMANGIPLEDRDRWDWLAHIRGAVMDRLQQTTAPAFALRRLSQLLDFPVTTLKEHHYMRSTMVDSQLDILEQPTLSEGDGKAQMLQQVEETVRGLLKA
ncbi:NRPS-like enzyme [Aspergillus eucalypticola CBS 122712]|uniref:gluconokinase n=1 Tax=Aspergillus eucalypticola (strain CBS 122712 / IBT 29274) TaxID=1448314 RepID=A0A317V0I4_ASPEC|nr:NRPS-like enzyme [Aspergillus eucalypticola CBS 122712]PWY67834.1 NRPS-like enzyme [Aspergillus eucalypticola CBS 122712]